MKTLTVKEAKQQLTEKILNDDIENIRGAVRFLVEIIDDKDTLADMLDLDLDTEIVEEEA